MITDKCVHCGMCAENCPAEAIEKKKNKYSINQDKCMLCGMCFDNCGINAIKEKN